MPDDLVGLVFGVALITVDDDFGGLGDFVGGIDTSKIRDIAVARL